mmetsp:Transcript_33331/g.66098  ORF Transcript_33331/g.66098 Transcript_33331/m.66098 type:complete len:227 (+) Transcript_33331:159-839(+)
MQHLVPGWVEQKRRHPTVGAAEQRGPRGQRGDWFVRGEGQRLSLREGRNVFCVSEGGGMSGRLWGHSRKRGRHRLGETAETDRSLLPSFGPCVHSGVLCPLLRCLSLSNGLFDTLESSRKPSHSLHKSSSSEILFHNWYRIRVRSLLLHHEISEVGMFGAFLSPQMSSETRDVSLNFLSQSLPLPPTRRERGLPERQRDWGEKFRWGRNSGGLLFPALLSFSSALS